MDNAEEGAQVEKKGEMEENAEQEEMDSSVDVLLESVDRQLQTNAAFLKLPMAFITAHLMREIVQRRFFREEFRVHYLDLMGNALGDQGAVLVASYLAQSSNLQYLNLSMNQIGAEGCRALCDALTPKEDGEGSMAESSSSSSSSSSASLLSSPPPRASSAGRQKARGNSVATGNATLQHFDLSVNQIGFGGIVALCDMLRGNGTLVSLNVRANQLRGEKCVNKLLELSAIAQNKINFKDLFV